MNTARDAITPVAGSTRSEASQEVAALGTPEERDQWARVMQLEAALLTAPNDDETNVIREKTRLAKGVLYWRLAESFKARVWNERRTLKDLDQALREAQNRWVRVQKARGSMPNNTGDFAARVAALRARLDAAQVRLADVAKQQNGLLESLARNELVQQKERISTYQIQARFALAAIYDRAAAPPERAPAATRKTQGELETVPARGRRDCRAARRRTAAARNRSRSAGAAGHRQRHGDFAYGYRRSRASTLRQRRLRRRNEPARH